MLGRKVPFAFGCILAVLFALALGGCATDQSGKQGESAAQAPRESAVQTPQVVPLEKPYVEIFVYEIETTPVLKNDYKDALNDCRTTLIDSLLKRNRYKKVQAPNGTEINAKSALLVKIRVSDMRIASFGARFWGGPFVGNSYMNIRMTLVDAETQKVVREEDFNSSNNVWAASWTFGATDRGLPSDMAEIMAAYIDKAVPAI